MLDLLTDFLLQKSQSQKKKCEQRMFLDNHNSLLPPQEFKTFTMYCIRIKNIQNSCGGDKFLKKNM